MTRGTSDERRDPFGRVVDRRSLLKGVAALGAGAGLAAAGLGAGVAGAHGHGHGPPWGRVLRPGSRPFPRVPEGTDMLPEIEHVVVLMMENHSYDSYFGALRRGDGFRFAPDGKPRNANHDGHHNDVRAFHMPSTCQLHALPGQDWNRSHRSWNNGRNDGFVLASTAVSMGYWDQTDLPFYYGLASTFPIADRCIFSPRIVRQVFSFGAFCPA